MLGNVVSNELEERGNSKTDTGWGGYDTGTIVIVTVGSGEA